MRRGVSFLVATQREDAAWTMIPRETPERKASTNLNPITYFGAAWATLGLVRSMPNAAAPATLRGGFGYSTFGPVRP